MTDLSIIIVSYNTRGLLADCLRSVEACRHEVACEVYVVDNDSRDGSGDLVKRDFPDVHLIRNRKNVGFAAANNQAIQRSSGRHIMLLNSDTVVRPGALGSLVEFMDGRPEAGYCGPRLLNGDGTHQGSAKRFPTMLSRPYAMLGLDRRHPHSVHAMDLHETHGRDVSFRTDWLVGACLVVRRDAIDCVGLMDEDYFLYFEETDWCRRLARAGFEGWYVASAEVTHYGGGSVTHTGEARPFSGNHPRHWVRSCRRYQRRHFGPAGMVAAQVLELSCYTLVWLRHAWRRNERSRAKARTVGSAIRHMLSG